MTPSGEFRASLDIDGSAHASLANYKTQPLERQLHVVHAERTALLELMAISPKLLGRLV